ncbi:MAG TPA: response regulator [Candidatus Angelobacter sp.]|nr:response regulator [Candidatus Angelobacter sp.]
MSHQPIILLAEDDDNDVFFMRRALNKAQVELPLHVVHHGKEALDYLNGNGPFADRAAHPLPSLILLDLKMPFFDGFEVLERIRSNASLRDIPVCVLTSSNEERDRHRAMELGAKGYFVKPPTVNMIHEMLAVAHGQHQAAVISA